MIILRRKARLANKLEHTTASGMQLDELDGVRAIAVFMVVLYHFWTVSGQPIIKLPFVEINLTFLISQGWVGVDLFYVLSGFLLFMSFARSHYENREIIKYSSFIKRRFLRIIPAYYISIMLVITLDQTYFLSNTNGIQHVIKHLLFIHNLFIDSHGSINGVFWTLGVEMQFYIVLPLLARAFVGKRNAISLPIVILVSIFYRYIIFNHLEMFMKPVVHNGFDWSRFIYSRQLIGSIDEFCIGITACNIWMYFKHNNLKSDMLAKISWYASGVGILSFVLILKYMSTHSIYDKSLFGCIGFTIIAGCLGIFVFGVIHNKGIIKKIFSLYFVRIFGILGYSIYIWHLYIANKLVQLPFITNCKDSNTKFIYLSIIAGMTTIVYSIIFYSLIEKPFISRKTNSKVSGI